MMNMGSCGVSAVNLTEGKNYDKILTEIAENIPFQKVSDEIIIIGADFIHNVEKNEFTMFWVLRPSVYSYYLENKQELKNIIYESMQEEKSLVTLLTTLIANNTKLIYNVSSNNHYFEVNFTKKDLSNLLNRNKDK